MAGETTGLRGNGASSIRRKILIEVVLSAGGLVTAFAGIGIFNALISWLHWR